MAALHVSAQLFEDPDLSEGYANYVPNPGFEATKREYCRWNQSGRAYMEAIDHWDSPTETTPDLFSTRVEPTCWAHPSYHSGGAQSTHRGENMAGIKIYGKGGTDTFWHEYLMVRLDSTLQPGERYYAELYTMRAVRSEKAANNIGLALSDTLLVTRDRMPLFITPVVNAAEVVSSRWNFWEKISGVFEVSQPANYIIIGNFYSDEDTRTKDYNEGEGGAYYYIDDVKVRRAKPFEALTAKPEQSVAPRPKRVLAKAEIISTGQIKLDSIDYRVGNTITLENIFFEFDKATLLPQSEAELDKLVDILTDYPHLHIQISGHTDNVGKDDYNLALSQARAKAVVTYLQSQEVASARLSYRGYGSSRPVASNATDAGRAKNRRVEFTVLHN